MLDLKYPVLPTLPVLTKASETFLLRPPQHVVIRSATPQLSKKVANFPPGQKNSTNLMISIRPSLITAAFVLSPRPSPSTKPAPQATIFYKTLIYATIYYTLQYTRYYIYIAYYIYTVYYNIYIVYSIQYVYYILYIIYYTIF